MTKSSERIKASGEVFTPPELVNEMLDKLPADVWSNPAKTWLEPSAGDGNFLVEIKRRLLEAGHPELHILNSMIFSIELIDDNHWLLQHRLGYLVDGRPNPKLWAPAEAKRWFTTSQAHPQGLALSNSHPYTQVLGLPEGCIYHHLNHVCYSALEYDMEFGGSSRPDYKQDVNALLVF